MIVTKQQSYEPDYFLILRIKTPDDVIYKVFATWKGGYINGDSWKINSGITKVEVIDNYYVFHGHTSSVYKCHKGSYGTTLYGQSVLQNIIDVAKEEENIEMTILEEDDCSCINEYNEDD